MRIIVADVLTIVTLLFIDYPFRLLFGRSLFSLAPHVDKGLHFIAGMLVADIYYCLPFRKTFLRVVGFVFAIAILWECVEPLLGFWGIIEGEPSSVFTVPWLVDTIGDIASTVVGGAGYGFVSRLCDKYPPAK